ncbi:MAG TPA: GNAT family N-acetyltransferase, partial [Rhodocyclaceae bacterium]|nr:GNAT family N-acetyltransferase [Rhodocyclaceae bacterium]
MATHGEQLQQDFERAATEAENADAFRASADAVRETIKTQLTQAGVFREAVNDAYAAVPASFYAVTAAKLGMTPEALYQQYPLTVGAQRPTDAAVFNQGEGLDSLRAQWDASGLDHAVSEANGIITLSKIVVPESARGAGAGTQAMQALVDYADRTGQHIVLTPSAEFGGNARRLVGFYKRFGFVENKGRNRAFSTRESMYRPASGKVLYQSGQAPDSVDAEVQRQLAETERAYGGRAAYDKAKAEGKTKLTYGQWVQVRTPNFKNWFGDWESDPAHASKVVDRDTGEPMVVYHGSDRGDIHEFHEGGHFGDSGQAADRLTQTERLGAIYPVWLHVADPMRSMDVGDDLAWDRAMIRAANGGHDGIVYRNDTEGPGRDSWLVWDSLQVKSAIGNRGTFDGTTGNILHQGPRGAYNPATLNIALLKGADLSTFLHEAGHHFLEMQLNLSAQLAVKPTLTEGEQSLVNDSNALLKWFGVRDIAEWQNMPFEERRAHHETFARGFEAYLYEGKAPSIELQGLFQRFRAWLMDVYHDLKNLNVDLTADVRGVMDRMLATTDEIVM